MAEKETEVQRLAKKYQEQLSTARPGGWREERSPDGRMTMYVSPKGERLSREEFFDKYPQGTGNGSTVAAGMMKDITTGRNLPQLPDRENLKIGVILQPGSNGIPGLRSSRPSAEFHHNQMMRDKTSLQAEDMVDSANRLTMEAARANRAGDIEGARSKTEMAKKLMADSAKQTELSGIYKQGQVRGLREYNRIEKGSSPTGGLNEYEQETLDYARDRAKPIPFPDKKK